VAVVALRPFDFAQGERGEVVGATGAMRSGQVRAERRREQRERGLDPEETATAGLAPAGDPL
jgi:hypothetical protein